MRILMLAWEYPPRSIGGLARHVEDLSIALAGQKHEVHVVTSGSSDLSGQTLEQGVHVHRIPPYPLSAPNFLTWILQLNLALLEYVSHLIHQGEEFDVVHAHDWLVAYCGRSLKHAFKIPLVATIHATEAGRNHGLHNDIQRYISSVEWWLAFEAWKVIVCSNHMRREVGGVFQVPEDKIAVIPNGVSPENFRTARAGSQFLSRYAAYGEELVFFVGRLVPEKGVQVLIDAAPRILAACPQAKFIIAGTGPMENELRQKVRLAGVDHKMYFTGYIDDWTRNKLYSAASIAVFPSLYEPFGIVVLEAMAAGTPVVVSDTGGLSEIVRHGENGLKAFPGNPDSLASNIIHLLQEKGYAQALRNKATEEIETIYDWRHIARSTVQIYQTVRREYLECPWNHERHGWRRAWDYAMALVGAREQPAPSPEDLPGYYQPLGCLRETTEEHLEEERV